MRGDEALGFARTRRRFLAYIKGGLVALGATIALALPDAARASPGKGPEVFVHAANSPANTDIQGKIAQFIISDPRVTGAQLMIPWSAVDNGSGNFDWSFVEQSMAPWVKGGKVVGLTFYGVEERTTWNFGKSATPAYVLAQVHKVRCNVADEPYLPDVPVYFEPAYADNYKRLIGAVVRHFENDKRVAYLRFGIGVGGESYPADKLGRDRACVKQWAGYGLSYERWLQRSLDQIDYIGSLKPKVRILVPFNNLGTLERPVTGRNTYAETIAEEAAKYGFWVGNAGFGLSDKFHGLYQRMRSRTSLYAQTGSPSRLQDRAKLPSILAAARQLHIELLELYAPVWLVAKDPGNKYYAQHGAAYRAALDSLAQPEP